MLIGLSAHASEPTDSIHNESESRPRAEICGQVALSGCQGPNSPILEGEIVLIMGPFRLFLPDPSAYVEKSSGSELMWSVSELSIQPRVAFFLPSASQPITRLFPGSNGYQSGSAHPRVWKLRF